MSRVTLPRKGVLTEMNYNLSFLDDARRVQDVWEANFDAEHPAICWMWMVGGVCALRDDWSIMELWCRRCCAGRVEACPRAPSETGDCCIVRVPRSVQRQDSKSERQPRARPMILIVESTPLLLNLSRERLRPPVFRWALRSRIVRQPKNG
jgi:hypothetical protein